MTLKPFDLERALAGQPVVTRDGRKVTEIVHFKTAKDGYPIIAIIHGSPYSYAVNGGFHILFGNESENDLFMAPVKREEWVNIYKSDNKCGYELGPITHPAESEARMGAVKDDDYITTVKIREWEE